MSLLLVLVVLLGFGSFGFSAEIDVLRAENKTLKEIGEIKHFSLSATVPAIRLRQGEKLQLLDGGGASINWYPFYKDRGKGQQKIHLGLVFLLSTDFSTLADGSKDAEYIFSMGLLAGWDWLQLGIGYDLISSESKAVFDARKKTFLMLNLTAAVFKF